MWKDPDIDWSIAHSLNSFFFHHDALEDPLLAYVQASLYLFAGALALTCVFARGIGRRAVRRAAVAAGLSTGLALLVGQILGAAWDRPRPFVTHHGLVHLFAAHAADSSFPSDHATATFAIGVAVVLRFRRTGLVVLILATIVSVGRVALGYHYPTDVLAGAALGTLAALLLWTPALRRIIDGISDAVGGAADRIGDRLLLRRHTAGDAP